MIIKPLGKVLNTDQVWTVPTACAFGNTLPLGKIVNAYHLHLEGPMITDLYPVGIYNGKPYYDSGINWFIWWSGTAWMLTDNLGVITPNNYGVSDTAAIDGSWTGYGTTFPSYPPVVSIVYDSGLVLVYESGDNTDGIATLGTINNQTIIAGTLSYTAEYPGQVIIDTFNPATSGTLSYAYGGNFPSNPSYNWHNFWNDCDNEIYWAGDIWNLYIYDNYYQQGIQNWFGTKFYGDNPCGRYYVDPSNGWAEQYPYFDVIPVI